MVVTILTKNVEVYNNSLKESRKAIYYKCVRVANFGLEKRVYNVTFFIVSYEYYNNWLFGWQDIAYNMYTSIWICNLYCECMICESEKNCARLFVMGLSLFNHIYVLPSVCLAPNRMWFLLNVCPPFIFDRVIEQQVTKVRQMIPILIGDHDHIGIVWNFYSRHVSLEVDAMFKSNIPNGNNIKDIHRN